MEHQEDECRVASEQYGKQDDEVNLLNVIIIIAYSLYCYLNFCHRA